MANAWLLIHPTTLAFHLLSAHFLTTLHTCFGLPHLIVAHLSWCHSGHTIDNLNTHLFRCPYGSECIIVHNTLWYIVITIVLESKTYVQREVSHLFLCHIWRWVDILVTRDDFCILMNIVIVNLICTIWCSLIDDDNTCNDNGCLRIDTILHRTSTRWWFHSPYYWNIWVFSFLFWFIPDHLCTYHYCASLKVFFSPLDAHFPLLITCVHSLTMCASHNSSSTSFCTWLGFLISSTHHS